jgi:hypothetical protein
VKRKKKKKDGVLRGYLKKIKLPKLKLPKLSLFKVQPKDGFGKEIVSIKPAAHERTCRAYLLFVTSWIDQISSCAGNIYGIFVIRDM